jgi:hypothetical protein
MVPPAEQFGQNSGVGIRIPIVWAVKDPMARLNRRFQEDVDCGLKDSTPSPARTKFCRLA